MRSSGYFQCPISLRDHDNSGPSAGSVQVVVPLIVEDPSLTENLLAPRYSWEAAEVTLCFMAESREL